MAHGDDETFTVTVNGNDTTLPIEPDNGIANMGLHTGHMNICRSLKTLLFKRCDRLAGCGGGLASQHNWKVFLSGTSRMRLY